MAPMIKNRPRVRVNKNKKKSWSKHSDIKEIEDYLEDSRLEERIGGPASEKPDEELFFVHADKEKTLIAQVETKFKKGFLRCHQNLGSYSKVPPPVNKQKHLPGKKKIKLLLLAEERRQKKFEAWKAPLISKKERFVCETFHDLWAKDVKNTEAEDPEIKELIEYRDEITKTRPVKVPCHRYQKPSLLPSVEVPHPGASYNPTYEDHQDLLQQAVVLEEKKEKEEMHVKRVLTDMFPTKAEAPTEKTWLAEMSQGLFETATELDNLPESSSKAIPEIVNPPVIAEDRLPKSRKRKRKELKIEKRTRKLEKLEKKRINDIFRIKSIKAEIKEDNKKAAVKKAKKDQIEMGRMFKPHTLSSHKYEPHDLEVNLSEELTGSLRDLKVEGSVLEDRYKSLQRRNVIEPRVKQKMKRKYKLKVQVKRSHRDFK